MLPYLIIFIISIIATYKAQKCKTKNFLFYLHTCFAIIPLVLLAAFRDESIGTDTANYIYLFEDAIENKGSIINYIFFHPSFEIGFLIYNFLLAQCTKSISIYFIVTYGIIIGLTYASALKLRAYISPHIFMFIYVFIFFSETLNGQRQYMAISLVIYAVANLLIGKKIKYLVLTIIACLFHTSSIISIVIGGTYWLIRKFPLYNHKLLYTIICIIVLIVAFGMGRFANMGWLPIFEEKLSNSITSTSGSGISNSYLLVCIYTLFVLLCSYKRSVICDLTLLTTIYTFIFYLSPDMNGIMYRLTLYFNIMMCISISYIFNTSKRVSTKMNVIILLTFYMVFYIFSIVVSGTHEVVPYSSSILGI